MNTTLMTYLIYLGVSIGMTVWVAHTLFKNGRVFLVEAFRHNEPMADSVNHLLVVGFYLVNLGFVSLFLKTDTPVWTTTEAMELLSQKVGVVLLVLGGMHFFNISAFNRWRRRELLHHAPPPVAPSAFLNEPPRAV
jgi:hypothetical protein